MIEYNLTTYVDGEVCNETVESENDDIVDVLLFWMMGDFCEEDKESYMPDLRINPEKTVVEYNDYGRSLTIKKVV